MVLKLRVQSKPTSQESKRSQPLKILPSDKSPKRVPKDVRKLEQEKDSRPTPRQFRSNPPSPQRRTTNSSFNRQHSSTPIPTFPSVSQNLRWNPYVKTSIIPDVSGIKVPPYRDRLHDASTRFNGSFNGFEERSPPKIFQLPVRDNPVRTVRNNIVEFVDQSTMTKVQSSVGCGSRYSESGPNKYSDMFLPYSVLPVRDTQDEYDAFDYPIYEPDDHPLYRTSSYLEPVIMKPSHHQYFLSPNCVRPLQNSVTSGLSYQGPQRIPCEFPISQHYVREEKKVLYNEGIFECQPYRPKRRMLKTPPSTPVRGSSQSREHNKSKDTVNIPFSHNSDSKYHNCCLKPCNIGTDNTCRVAKDNQHGLSGPQKQCKGIAWPKRVLASEMNIDAFLYNAPEICKARKSPIQWTMCPHKFPGEL